MNPKRHDSRSILIDSALILYCLRNDLYKPLAFYSLLRMHHRDGLIRNTSINYMATVWQVSPPTARKYMHALIKLRWIIDDKKAALYRIISIQKLRQRYGLHAGMAALFTSEMLHNPRPAFIGAVISYAHIKQREGSRVLPTNGRGCQLTPISGIAISADGGHEVGDVVSGYPYFPVRRLAKVLSVSQRTAERYRSEAFKAGYIRIQTMARADPGLLTPPSMKQYIKCFDTDPVIGRSGSKLFLYAASMVRSYIPVIGRRY